ncbi:MAG: hypothetical protein LQ339_007864 [Xanthoria mediterranea]|nr:MAG: hypothetical protein LQ339_007864 [Xanthoria mediterranea]
MVYDWEGKEGTMMDLYIHQGKSLEEVMEWFKVNQDFAPSKRAFQSQIKRWNFPSKHIPSHADPNVVARVRELWARNISQKEMLAMLREECSPSLTERQLSHIREKEGLKLRAPNLKPIVKNDKSSVPSKRKRGQQADGDHVSDQPIQAQDQPPQPDDSVTHEATARVATIQLDSSTDLPKEVLQKRQAWHQRLQAESLERLEKRTRRRRTKVYAGLPPDPPAPPRFPSETTLEEAKSILQLDKSTYNSIRATFENICRENNVMKKTEAGHDKWQAVKNQLIDEFLPIQPLFRTADQQQLDHHYLALEMICNDVTKKLRTMKTRVTIADAKNVLGLNPEQGRQLKAAFHQILKADHFTSKLESGSEHWQELKQQWISDSSLLQSILASGEADPQHGQKVKALEHLCRDVMKRLRDSQTNEAKMRKANGLPVGAASPQPANTNDSVPTADRYQSPLTVETPERPATSQGTTYDGISTLASQALASTHLPLSPPPPIEYQQHVPPSIPYNSQIDPTLLSAATNLPVYQHQSQQETGAPSAASFGPTPIYFRLSPSSQIKTPPTVWVEALASPALSVLRRLAISNRPYANLRVTRIEGFSKEQGGEMKWNLEEDDELMAYLNHVKGTTPTFIVDISYHA